MAPPLLSVAIAGAQKSGTTSLLRYMSEHPQLSGQGPVEFGYLFTEDEWSDGWERAYARYFYGARTERLVAKSAMLYARRLCVERLAEHNPRCLIVLILRDPVERAFSSYRMERNKTWIDRPFDEITTLLDNRDHAWNRLFIQFGEYAPALRQLYEFFPREQVKVLVYEEFSRDPAWACRDIFEFVGVDTTFAPQTAVAHNVHREVASPTAAAVVRWLQRPGNPVKRAAKQALPPAAFDRLGAQVQDLIRRDGEHEEMPAQTRDALAGYYVRLNRDLESLLGRDLSAWTGMGKAA